MRTLFNSFENFYFLTFAEGFTRSGEEEKKASSKSCKIKILNYHADRKFRNLIFYFIKNKNLKPS